ncbi:winged helix-turn-helix domain-containing protein [Candidatus Nitrosotalea bavarica]|uniref:winged helix-turn-helix domain-containing protein n=1 Tax=Candidatus Nitrosotalea bavarica TaxID=1903277 RepID=UPI001FE87F63|nr:winged helix-turn-helix domain-containing protein [Candidatus Nitrosotalea bavarica]
MAISMKQQYRSELGIVSEILQVTMDCGIQGTIISSIARRANLSHYTAMEKCQKLLDFGLMESRIDKKSRSFIITEKGIQFYHQMQKFLEIAQEIKIRC